VSVGWERFDELMRDEHVQRRLAGEPHRHHSRCIHNLPPNEQIALRGKTSEWWEAMGLPIPMQIKPDQWGSSGTETTP
jgi:hypothetical protein